MDDRGRLTAPGSLLNGTVLAPEDEAPSEGNGSLAELAARYGLRPSSARPSLLSYLRMVWQRRHFIVAYSTARSVSMYTEARLGQLWQVLTPLLNSAVYYLVFGILFQANRGIEHYTAYLVTGVFIFGFTERSIVVGSTVMRANIALIRALHFPRASLPLAYVLVEFQQLLLSLLVLFAIVLGTGEPLTWYWLLLVPVMALRAGFQPADPVPDPDLAVFLRGHVQHRLAARLAAAMGQERAAAQPGGGVHLADQVLDHGHAAY
jgi:teichoic acid transport system permease protein